jgi:hypothetical protein
MSKYLAPLLAVVLATGCAHSVNELARESSRAAVDESVNQLTQDDAKQQLAEAASDPRVEETVRNLTDQVAEGVLRALESERAQKQLQGITATATRAVTQQMLASLASPAMRAQMQDMAGSVTDAALTRLGSSLQRDFVPGLRDALARDLADGAASGLKNGQFNQALGATAQNVAYSAMLGVNDGLRTSWLGDTGDELRGVAHAGVPWLKLMFWGSVMAALCLVSIAAIVIARSRRARTEVRRLETATLLLATAMRERHGNEETDEIVSVVRDALQKSAEDQQRHGLLGMFGLKHR